MNREQTQEVEEKELERTSSISEWAERIRGNWNKVEGWSWEVILAWMLSKGFRLPEEQEPEPTPTEMVKRLLEKGWTIEQGDDTQLTEWYRLRDPEKPHFTHTFSVKQVTDAYRKTFPPKKKVEVEVWMSRDGSVRDSEYISNLDEAARTLTERFWKRGTATFWVEDSGET